MAIDELEDLFGAARLYEARTEVGQLAYDEDEDGNGALSFDEFVNVMDKLGCALCAVGGVAVESAACPWRVPPAAQTPRPLRTVRCPLFGCREYHKARPTGSAAAAAGAAAGGDAAAAASAPISFVFGTEGGSLPLKDVVYRTFDDPTFSPLAEPLAVVIFAAIVIAVVVYVLQSLPLRHAGRLAADVMATLENFAAFVFTVDFMARLATCPDKRRFVFSFATLIDVLTILPFYLDGIAELFSPRGGFAAAMRVLRVLRVLRILRASKYVPYVNLMVSAGRASLIPIGMALGVLVIAALLLAFGALYAERGEWKDAAGAYVLPGGRTSPFTDVAASMYWVIVTLATVGYGDITPSSDAGKLVGAVTALAGCVIVSFPVSIYTEVFSKEYGEFEKTRRLVAELGSSDLLARLTAARRA